METGSFVRASERLNVIQSTVTARLKGLESELGQTLLHRQKSGVELTSCGFKFKRYADLMAELWRQVRREHRCPLASTRCAISAVTWTSGLAR